jgi:glycosyltransferase involved in cell wall biosynthesis
LSNPAVSIVCAAYNRADVLRYAIQSVLQSDFPDWELIVVGDGCTDHTADVVHGFGDPRISFENLPANSGGQAAPNNRGVAKARGNTIFFLNQDDMYMRGHVGALRRFLDDSGADLAWCPSIALQHSSVPSGPPVSSHDLFEAVGAVDDGGFDPRIFVIASTWAVRRQACETFGPWRGERETRVTPSQDWLFRARSRGARFAYRERPSVLCIHSGPRRLSYRTSVTHEHARAWSWLEGGAQEHELFACLAECQARELYRLRSSLAKESDLRIREFAKAFAMHPQEVRLFLEGVEPGGFVEKLRRFNAEAQLLEVGQVVCAGKNLADPYLSGRWHSPEGTHRWSATAKAELIFAVPADAGALALRLRLHPLREGEPVATLVNGKPAPARAVGGPGNIQVPLGTHDGVVSVILEVQACRSPQSLGLNDDARELGVSLLEFELVADTSAG